MERQFLVCPDRPVKEDHLWPEVDRFERKISTWPNRSIYVWAEISGNFGIMGRNRRVHVLSKFRALADKTNNERFSKPFFRVIYRSNGLIAKRSMHFDYCRIFAKSVLKPLNYLTIAAAAPINTNGLPLYYNTQE